MEPTRQRGRKRKSTESTQKPKKVPQRGMGVAQLEQLRNLSELTQPHHQPLPQFYVPACSGFVGYGPVGFNQMGLGLVGPIGGPGLGGPGSGPKLGEASRELASVPNLNQILDHWGLNNSKRPLNVDREKSLSLASYVCGNSDQEAEVKAVHQKGDSRVIEYGFFPQQTNDCKSNSTNPEEEGDDNPPSLSLTTGKPDSPSTSSSISIDLSLRL